MRGLVSRGFAGARRTVWLLAVPIQALAAQGAVTGRVTLLEKPGQKTTDLDQAVVWLESSTPSAARARPTKVEVAMRGRQFAPHVRVATVGSTVAFPNHDPFSHNIFSTTPGSAFDLGIYGRGQARDQLFSKTGPIPLYCNVHAKMTAFLVVVPTPWYGQPGEDGRWTIDGVPAGSYTVHVWHERGGVTTRTLAVPASGVALTAVELDARGYVVAQHKDKFGKDYTGPGQIRY